MNLAPSESGTTEKYSVSPAKDLPEVWGQNGVVQTQSVNRGDLPEPPGDVRVLRHQQVCHPDAVRRQKLDGRLGVRVDVDDGPGRVDGHVQPDRGRARGYFRPYVLGGVHG